MMHNYIQMFESFIKNYADSLTLKEFGEFNKETDTEETTPEYNKFHDKIFKGKKKVGFGYHFQQKQLKDDLISNMMEQHYPEMKEIYRKWVDKMYAARGRHAGQKFKF